MRINQNLMVYVTIVVLLACILSTRYNISSFASDGSSGKNNAEVPKVEKGEVDEGRSSGASSPGSNPTVKMSGAPEPSTFSILALGAAAMLIKRRGKRGKR